MRGLTALGVFLPLTASAQLDGGKCSYAVELVQVQDGSGSFEHLIQVTSQKMTQIIATLTEKYTEFKYGLSSFIDKPVPFRGLGHYGGNVGTEDYCYNSQHGLTSDGTEIADALADLSYGLGSGGDDPEAAIDGLMYAASDPSMGWSTDEYSPGGRPIVRIAMVITDEDTHLGNQSWDGTGNGWNYPIYIDQGEIKGGFGSAWFYDSYQISADVEDQYMELTDLFAIELQGGSLTPEQKTRFDELVAACGPYPWPEIIPNSGDGLHPERCAEVEYASIEQAGALLQQRNVLPIFLVAEPVPASDTNKKCEDFDGTTQECIVQMYTDYIQQMGVPGVVAALGEDDVAEKIVNAVAAMTEMICKQTTTTTPAPENITTVTTAGVQTPAITPQVTAVATPNVTPAVTPAVSLPIGEATQKPHVTLPGNIIPIWPTVKPIQHTTAAAFPGDTTTTTTTTAGVVAVVVPPSTGGASVGTIAGATAGAVAGAAAIGGLLYSKFGAGLFGHSAPAELDAVQQVDVPENPVERETMEEVTMDMFQ